MALLYDFLAPLLAPVPLIRANQDGPAPKRPYGTYAIRRASDPRHAVTAGPDADGNAVLRAHRELGVEVQIYGPGSEAKADRLQLVLKAETVAQSAERLGLSLATVQAAQHVPALLDDQRWEERGIVEFAVYVLAEIADTPGLIERVETEAAWRAPGAPDDPGAAPGTSPVVVVDGAPAAPDTAPAPSGAVPPPFVQSTPATVWTIRHNLGRYPDYLVVDSAGNRIWPSDHYPDRNTIILTFSVPTSGTAELD